MKPYCLYCLVPLPPKRHLCPRCRRNSFPSEQRTYWNRIPALARLEGLLKALIVLVTVPFCLSAVEPVSGPGGGLLFILPVLPALGLWMTVSLLTHRDLYFSPRTFWGSAFLLLGIEMLLAGGLRNGLRYALGSFAVAGLCVLLCVLGQRWRQGLIARATESMPEHQGTRSS